MKSALRNGVPQVDEPSEFLFVCPRLCLCTADLPLEFWGKVRGVCVPAERDADSLVLVPDLLEQRLSHVEAEADSLVPIGVVAPHDGVRPVCAEAQQALKFVEPSAKLFRHLPGDRRVAIHAEQFERVVQVIEPGYLETPVVDGDERPLRRKHLVDASEALGRRRNDRRARHAFAVASGAPLADEVLLSGHRARVYQGA
jgi:hypothetical protein